MPLPLALGLLGAAGLGQYAYDKYRDWQSSGDAGKLKGLLGVPAQPYQMSEAELFPGEQPIQGLQTGGTGLLGGEITPQQFYGGLLGIPKYQSYGVQKLAEMVDPANVKSPYERVVMDASGQPWGMNRKTGQFEPVPTAGGAPAQKPYTDIGELEADRRAGRITQEQYDYMMEMMTKKGLASSAPYYTPLPTSTGIYSFDSRTGRIAPLQGVQGAQGGPLLPIAIDPNAQAAVTGAKKEAEIRSKATTEAAVDLPKTIASGEQTLKIIDELLRHPGRATATGLSGTIDPRNYVAGTQARDFQVRLDQLKGKAFLEAYSMLKGGGQITEIEGQKAENAMARLDRAQSDEEYVQALTDMQDVIRKGMERAKTMASRGGQIQRSTAAPTQSVAPTMQAPVRRYNPATGRFE